MPLGLDDDELGACIGMYELRLNQRTKTIHSLQAQIPAKDSGLRPATGPLTRRDLLHGRGEEQIEKQLLQLSPVEEEQPNSHFVSLRPNANIRDPGAGKANAAYCNEEIQPRKLTHSSSLPSMPSHQHHCSTPDLRCRYVPGRNIRRRGFNYAEEFEKELRELDVTLACKPKARSNKKSSHTRTESDMSSTSSSPPQVQKRGTLFWKPKKDVHSHGSTSSTINTEGDIHDQELATSVDAPPPYTEKEKRATRLERLLKHLHGRGSDSIGTAPGGGASQYDSTHQVG